MMRRVLCAWFPSWPVQRRVAEQPGLRGRAVAVVSQERGVERVTACSASARTMGVVTGMTSAEAHSFFASQSLSVFRDDPAADRAALEKIADDCTAFSPLAALEESQRPESFLLDIAGCGPVFGGEAALLDAMAKRMADWTIRLACSDTWGASWALAHAFTEPTLAPPGQTAAAIQSLPTILLRIDPEIAAALEKLGVLTIGAVERLPKESLDMRFGPMLRCRLDQAYGRVREILNYRPYITRIERACDFAEPVESAEWVLQLVGELLDGVLEDTHGHDGVSELELRLTRENASPYFARWAFPKPTREHKRLLELIKLRLERVDRSGRVVGVRLIAAVVAPLEARQTVLFDELEPIREREESRQRLFERLASRLGKDAVLEVRSAEDPQPEFQCQFVPVVETVRPKTASRKQQRNAAGDNPGVGAAVPTVGRFDAERWRPFLLLPRPESIMVEPEAGPPRRIRHSSQWWEVQRSWGAERIQTGGWRGQAINREYYRVALSTGSRWWIFRDLAAERWFLHGCFA